MACWSPEKLTKWVLLDSQITGTIVAMAGSWSCLSHHQSRFLICLYSWRRSESARHTDSKSSCGRQGRCAKTNCMHTKISLWYKILKICEWSSIQLSSPILKLSSERSFRSATADCNHMILKLSSPHARSKSIYVFVHWLNDRTCWMSCADRNGCYWFHCSECLQWLLYNPVALVHAFPPVLSTPTTNL